MSVVTMRNTGNLWLVSDPFYSAGITTNHHLVPLLLVVSQQGGLGPFSVEFACSLCVWVGSLSVPQLPITSANEVNWEF